jgi:O-methyltransferase
VNRLKTGLKRIVNRMGFEMVRIPKAGAPGTRPEHEIIRPIATYSPWNRDAAFLKAYEEIRPFTLVDVYRCYELWQLVEQSAKLDRGSLIEIGVWQGGTGALIARRGAACGIRDKVYLCDTFTGVVKAGAQDSLYRGGEHADTSRRIVEDLLHTRMGLDNVEVLEGIFPEETGHRVEHLAFRFCHIDVDVYQSARDIVGWIWDRMIPGGIVVYDDYGSYNCGGITTHVEEQRMCRDRLLIHNLNGHAIVMKL